MLKGPMAAEDFHRTDIRETALYRRVEEFCRRSHEPGFGEVTGGFGIVASPTGKRAVFTGTTRMDLVSPVVLSVCLADLASNAIRRLTPLSHNSHGGRWSPDGRMLAFAHDKGHPGVFQLTYLDGDDLATWSKGPEVDGTIEYLQWSPDGKRVLLGVAGLGADLAGMQGATTVPAAKDARSSWMPRVETGKEGGRWRRIWVVDVASGKAERVSPDGVNPWEASWCGDGHIALIASDDPGEAAWYGAWVELLDLKSGAHRKLYQPSDQIGWLAASPSGNRIAVADGFTSDRFGVAGELCLLDPQTGEREFVDTAGVDVSWIVWRDDDRLLYAGMRGLETIICNLDVRSRTTQTVWSSTQTTCGVEMYPDAFPLGESGCVMLAESHALPPEVRVVGDGRERTVTSLANSGSAYAIEASGGIEPFYWEAPDGLKLDGWLVLPKTTRRPHALVAVIHGGPVSTWRPLWQRRRIRLEQVLSHFGYAVFLPNPRGGVGHGREFALRVKGDMGGLDTYDILSGLEALVERGIADPARLGITGISYGGFMSSWIVTRDQRFAASIPVAPTTDWYSFHWTTNIPSFDRLFLQDDPARPDGAYFHRSPVMFADRVKTPTLNIAGALDLCTPPAQAEEFHRALLEAGVESVLAIYPEEGHGIAKMPAAIDYATRVVAWFERHMPA